MPNATFRGDFAGLEHLQKRLADMKDYAVAAANNAKPRLRALVEEDFNAAKSPDGEPWKPLAASTLATGRHDPPLTATGAMKGSLQVRRAGAKVKGKFAAYYSVFSQGGTEHGEPARPTLPEGDDLPGKWNDAIVEACKEEADKALGGG